MDSDIPVLRSYERQERNMLKDKDIREPLFDFLEDTYGKVRIIEEKTMGRSRADLVMITEGSLVGIEIKSDADTYARLASQVKDYDKYYDYNIAVVGSSHGAHINEHIPEYWGIITVESTKEGSLDFYILRRPAVNPKMDLTRKLSILWRPELAMIQEKVCMPKYKDKSRKFVTDKVVGLVPDKLSAEELDRLICSILFERDYSMVEETLKEYRKGELQKAIERTDDPQEKLLLMMEQAERQKALKRKRRRRP